MNRREEVRTAWLIRKLEVHWLDPSVARLWAIALAVLMTLAVTGIMAMMVLAKINKLINVDFINVGAHNRQVTHDRIVVSVVGGVGVVAALALAAVSCLKSREHARSNAWVRAPARKQFWLFLMSALAVLLTVAAFFRFGPQYL